MRMRVRSTIVLGAVLSILAPAAFAQKENVPGQRVPGLVALWPANADAKDAVGNVHGSLVSGVSFAPGKFGQAFQLDGKGYLQMPARRWGFSTRGTMTAWIKTTKAAGTVVSLYGGTAQDEMLLMVTNGKIGIFNHTREHNYMARLSNTSVNTGNWIFVAGVLDGGNLLGGLRIYVNGAEEKGTTVSEGSFAPISDSAPRSVRIGWRTNEYPPELFNGLIDDVAIFDRALGAAEIEKIFRGGPLGGSGDSGKDPFSNPSKEPRSYVGEPNPRTRWRDAKEHLPEEYQGFNLDNNEAKCFAGFLHLEEKQKLPWSFSGGNSYDLETQTSEGYFTGEQISYLYAEPGNVVSVTRTGALSAVIEGVGKGIGKLSVILQGQRNGKPAKGYALYVVIVSGVKRQPPRNEIRQADFSGKAIRKKDGSPVGGARITFNWIGKFGENLGTFLTDEEILTKSDGTFRFRATNLPAGRIEIMIQLLGQLPDPEDKRKDLTIEYDLWPYRQYVIDLTYDLANEGTLNLGNIVLDRVELIDFRDRPLQIIIPKVNKGGSASSGPGMAHGYTTTGHKSGSREGRGLAGSAEFGTGKDGGQPR
jgi:hypothetical protein